ncbi:hypothetical protein Taro_045841 [Colocasia esculenta]|uniref:Retrotransposon gag domain-containing protein n=1 Tax=Colocasia esculenta TaxID=4460 RepID=A0A843X6V9_COLES|nr:hypothetical protein [Colocasia esculenta]
MPSQGKVQEEVSAEESVAQPQVAPAAAAAAGGQQQQEYQPQPQQYADWFPLAEQFFRNLYQGAYQLRQAAAGVQPPVPPPVVPEQQVEPEVEQPERQQRSGTGSTQAGRRRTTVMEDRTALLERFLHLLPPMFSGEYDLDKAESWTHELEHIFETMECAEEDQVRVAVYQIKGVAHEWWRVQRQTHFQGQRLDHITWQRFLEVFHGEYFPDYARRERRDQFHELVQGDLIVSQYHQRFIRLLRHVPHVASSEQACAERFIAGLRPDLRWGVTAHMCNTLGEAMAKATALSRETWQPQQQQYQQQQQGGASSSSGSCLLSGADGAGSRGVSPGLQSSQYSRVLSRAAKMQFATHVACRATSGEIAPRGMSRSSSIQFSTCSSYPSTSTLPSSRHLVSSSRGSTSSGSAVSAATVVPVVPVVAAVSSAPATTAAAAAPAGAAAWAWSWSRDGTHLGAGIGIKLGYRPGPPWALGPVLRVATGTLAMTWSRQNGLIECQAHAALTRPGHPSRLLFQSSRFDHLFGVAPGTAFATRSAPESPFAEDATILEVAILWQRHSRSPQDRDTLEHCDLVATATAVATWLLPLPGTPVLESLLREYSGLRVCSSWQPSRRTLELRGKWRHGTVVWPDYGGYCVSYLALTRREGETSQQRQGARRAEETRRYILYPFRVSGSVGGDRENRVLGVGRGSEVSGFSTLEEGKLPREAICRPHRGTTTSRSMAPIEDIVPEEWDTAPPERSEGGQTGVTRDIPSMINTPLMGKEVEANPAIGEDGEDLEPSSTSLVPLIHPCPIISMAPKAKKLASCRRPSSSRAGDDDRAPTERRTKLRDDRLPELVVPPYLFPNLQPLFDTQEWTSFLYSHTVYSPTAVRDFFNHLGFSKDKHFYTTVKGTTFQLTANLISKALQIPNSGADILTHTRDASVYYHLLTLEDYDGTKKIAKMNANSFPPLNRMIHHIFTTMIVPKHGSRELVTDLHKSLFTFFLRCEPINLPVLMLGLILQCFYQPRRSIPFACPITSLMRFIGIDIPDSECITLNSRISFDLTTAHIMGYKLIDGVVTPELKGKAPAIAMDVDHEIDAADANAVDDDEEADDEDSQSESLDAPGDSASDADVESSLRDLLAQMQLQMSTRFDKLHAHLDTVDTSIEALANTRVQLQLQLTRLQTELQDTPQAPAPPANDAA